MRLTITAAWQAPDPALESLRTFDRKGRFRPYVIVGGAPEFRNSGGAYFCRVLLDDALLGAHSRCERVKPSRGERTRWSCSVVSNLQWPVVFVPFLTLKG